MHKHTNQCLNNSNIGICIYIYVDLYIYIHIYIHIYTHVSEGPYQIGVLVGWGQSTVF